MAVRETVDDRPRPGRPADRRSGKPSSSRSTAPRSSTVRSRTSRRRRGRLAWQASPPHADLHRPGQGNRLWDLDGNEYIDFHLGYGAMVVGHAHPTIVEAITAPGGARHAFRAADEAPGRDRGEPRRALRPPAVAVLQLGDRGDARGGAADARQHRPRHDHQDRGDLSWPSRLADVQRRSPTPSQIGPREHPVTVPQAPGIPQAFAELVRVVPFNDLTEARRAFEENRGQVAGMIVEPAMMNCGVVLPGARLPAGAQGPVPRARRVPRVRRGEDGRDGRLRRGRRGVRRDAGHRLPGEGDRRRDAVRRDRGDRGALPTGHRGRVRHGGDLQRQPAHDGREPRRPHRGPRRGRVRRGSNAWTRR